MQSIREIGPPCTRASVHTQTQPCPAPATASPHPPLKTTPHTQQRNTSTRNPPHPNNSLLALQHVSLRSDESFHTRNMTCKRCNPYGRLALPARARISAHPNTTLPCTCNRIHYPLKTTPCTQHRNTTTRHNHGFQSSSKQLTRCITAHQPSMRSVPRRSPRVRSVL